MEGLGTQVLESGRMLFPGSICRQTAQGHSQLRSYEGPLAYCSLRAEPLVFRGWSVVPVACFFGGGGKEQGL